MYTFEIINVFWWKITYFKGHFSIEFKLLIVLMPALQGKSKNFKNLCLGCYKSLCKILFFYTSSSALKNNLINSI